MERILLVVATRNRGKSKEIREFLRDFPVEIKDLNDFGPIPEAAEDGDTFEENAYKKASFTAKVLGFRPWPMIPAWRSRLWEVHRASTQPDMPDRKQAMKKTTASCLQALSGKHQSEGTVLLRAVPGSAFRTGSHL